METVTTAAMFQKSVCSKLWYFLFALLFPCCQTLHARASPLSQSPFMSIWNAPTELCMKKFKIYIDTRVFQMAGSTLPSARAQNISLFYTDRLGYYPYINLTTGQSYNGGIPQMVNMNQHLKKAKEDILYYMPYSTQKGLAVIDWEDWRPTWMRNWASKAVYRKQSVEFAQQKDLSLTGHKASSVAKAQFEFAAKNLMLDTLKQGKSLRPNYLWGFYLFPNCHNYDYNQNPHNYTGRCPAIEVLRNDHLRWLWKESTAFYPNIYLETALKSSYNAALFSRSRVQEAMRLSTLPNVPHSQPVFVYTRPVFTDQPFHYLSKTDLINTIGESAALGTNGFIMWGDVNLTLSVKTCTTLNHYLVNVLNPYVINITLATKLCSKVLCQNNGACVRKYWNTNHYLHLNGKNMLIERKQGSYFVRGQPTLADLNQFALNFKCHCYAGRTCKTPSDLQSIGNVSVCMSHNICIKTNFNTKSNNIAIINKDKHKRAPT